MTSWNGKQNQTITTTVWCLVVVCIDHHHQYHNHQQQHHQVAINIKLKVEFETDITCLEWIVFLLFLFNEMSLVFVHLTRRCSSFFAFNRMIRLTKQKVCVSCCCSWRWILQKASEQPLFVSFDDDSNIQSGELKTKAIDRKDCRRS